MDLFSGVVNVQTSFSLVRVHSHSIRPVCAGRSMFISGSLFSDERSNSTVTVLVDSPSTTLDYIHAQDETNQKGLEAVSRVLFPNVPNLASQATEGSTLIQ